MCVSWERAVTNCLCTHVLRLDINPPSLPTCNVCMRAEDARLSDRGTLFFLAVCLGFTFRAGMKHVFGDLMVSFMFRPKCMTIREIFLELL